ncbi:hypothetical protein [Legionella jamestowniensis]|uniref:hypothetical protein n=1 Tax=Legionella jamestowniensis TaxID=455 RepID=UPI0010418BFA|nr:hypothetical protein [Legionella jamestowniensis]
MSSVLFLLISIPIFYVSYQKSQEEEKKINDKFLGLLEELTGRTKKAIEKGYLVASEADKELRELHALSFRGKQEEFVIAYFKALAAINNNIYHPDLERNKRITLTINTFISFIKIKSKQSMPLGTLAYQAFLGFVGAFGSVAGCSAGLMGLLGGLGIISGFSAVPVLGIAVLILAVGCGIYSALTAVDALLEKNSKKELCKKIKTLNSAFRDYEFIKNNEIKWRMEEPPVSSPRQTNRIVINPARTNDGIFSNRDESDSQKESIPEDNSEVEQNQVIFY